MRARLYMPCALGQAKNSLLRKLSLPSSGLLNLLACALPKKGLYELGFACGKELGAAGARELHFLAASWSC